MFVFCAKYKPEPKRATLNRITELQQNTISTHAGTAPLHTAFGNIDTEIYGIHGNSGTVESQIW